MDTYRTGSIPRLGVPNFDRAWSMKTPDLGHAFVFTDPEKAKDASAATGTGG
jgi:hypothetical protein